MAFSAINILNSSGTVLTTVSKGSIRIETAGSLTVTPSDDGTLILDADPSIRKNASFYDTKFKAIIEGGELLNEYSFTGFKTHAPYVSTINNRAPDKHNAFWISEGRTGRVGLFPSTGSYVIPTYNDNELPVTDVAVPDFDCEDLAKLNEMLVLLDNWYKHHRERNLTEGFKLFRQYQAVVHYWNYLINEQMLIANVTMTANNKMKLSIGYRHTACSTVSSVSVQLHIAVAGDNYVMIDDADYKTFSNSLTRSIYTTKSYPQDSYCNFTDAVVSTTGMVFDTPANYSPVENTLFHYDFAEGASLTMSSALMRPRYYMIYNAEIPLERSVSKDRMYDGDVPADKPIINGTSNVWTFVVTWTNTQFGTSVSKTITVTTAPISWETTTNLW